MGSKPPLLMRCSTKSPFQRTSTRQQLECKDSCLIAKERCSLSHQLDDSPLGALLSTRSTGGRLKDRGPRAGCNLQCVLVLVVIKRRQVALLRAISSIILRRTAHCCRRAARYERVAYYCFKARPLSYQLESAGFKWAVIRPVSLIPNTLGVPRIPFSMSICLVCSVRRLRWGNVAKWIPTARIQEVLFGGFEMIRFEFHR